MYAVREKDINFALRCYCSLQTFSYYMPNVIINIIIDYTICMEEWSDAEELNQKITRMLLESIPEAQQIADSMVPRIENIFNNLYKNRIFAFESSYVTCWTDCGNLLRQIQGIKESLYTLGRNRASWRKNKLTRKEGIIEYLLVRRNRSLAEKLYGRDLNKLDSINEQLLFLLDELHDFEKKLEH